MTPTDGISGVRDATCGLMRIIRKVKRKRSGSRKNPQFTETVELQASFVGTAWCIAADRYLVTAHHTFNGGNARSTDDHFYVFTAPGNGPSAYPFPVTGFPFEDASKDLAIVEIGPSPDTGQHIPSVAVTFARPPDGTAVLTYGFPSPRIEDGNVDEQLNWLGGAFFLKAHANEGIVSGQYDIGNSWRFEFNVGWHHGESGGPIFSLDPLAAFSVMQNYRNIQSPHGVVAGPHMGIGLEAIKDELVTYGATIL